MLKLKSSIFKKILFVALFCIMGMFAGCESIPTNAEDDYFLLFFAEEGIFDVCVRESMNLRMISSFVTESSFDESLLCIEYGVYTKGKYDGDFYRGCCYYFDEDSCCIRINTPDRIEINNSDKFIFGKHQNNVVESVAAQESFYKVDTLVSSFSGRCYEIKMISCNSKGEITISLNNKQIKLNQNQWCYCPFTYPDGTNTGRGCCVNYLQEIVVINNVGFIKKTDI